MNSFGFCRPDLAALRQTFEAQLGDELGAAVAVTIDGEVVAHLWGGWRDKARTQPWTADTLVPVYSTGKAMVALAMAHLHERGALSYDDPIRRWWPNWTAAADLTVAQVLSHQAGVPGLRAAFDPADWYDFDAMIARIEAEVPFWPPGTAHGYHPVIFGFLAGYLARAATGCSIGDIVHQALCNPLDLDLWFGVDAAHADRIADLQRPTAAPDLGTITPERRAAFLEKWSAPAGRGGDVWRAANLPAVNMHTTADSLARAFALVACGGQVDGQRLFSPETVSALCQPYTSGPDRVLPYTVQWGAGVLRNAGLNIYGPNPDTVGHSGWGGSCVFADADARLSFAYVMNKQSNRLLGDPRPQALIAALYGSL